MSRDPETAEVIDRIQTGDRRALARGISIVEDRRAGADSMLAALYGPSLATHVVGITGAPGSGKSSLASELITHLRSADLSIAVLAVDPSSPFSGGAVLGDRIRMQSHASDPGVYIRSMSTRGHLGGLSDTASRVLVLLGAATFDVVIVETVGVGQSETEIAGTADTTVVVVNPGWGDGIQAAKAGLLEIADVFCINKADLGGCDDVERELRLMLELGGAGSWDAPIVRTSATSRSGIDELWAKVDDHRRFLTETGEGAARLKQQVTAAIRSAAISETINRSGRLAIPDDLVDRVASGEMDPWSAARGLV